MSNHADTEMRVVVDTNTLISAALKTDSTPGLCVDVVRKFFTFAFSEETFFELERVWLGKKFDRFADVSLRREWLDELAAISVFVPIENMLSVCSDPDDNMIVETAVVAGADLIITGDKGLLSLKVYEGVPITNAKTFVEGMAGKFV